MTMTGPTFAPIVEGYGEIKAFPTLLRKLAWRAGFYSFNIAPPVRLSRSEMIRQGDMSRAVHLASMRVPDHNGAVIILLDSDDDCPVKLSLTVAEHARSAGTGCPVVAIAAQREYESIFLASASSLIESGLAKKDSAVAHDPESIRGAKEKLRSILVDGRYKETQEQERFTAKIDLEEALTCRWLQKRDKEIRIVLDKSCST
jgi:hypothetical protein